MTFVQEWGGATEVHAEKLWARAAITLGAPENMSNRSTRVQQIWREYRLDALVGDAPRLAGVQQVPPPPCWLRLQPVWPHLAGYLVSLLWFSAHVVQAAVSVSLGD